MLRQLAKWVLGLAGLCLLNGFQCNKPVLDLGPALTFYPVNWQGEWLDNSGAAPLITTNTVSRIAFGFRLSAKMSLDGTDSLLAVPGEKANYFLENQIQKIQIFTPNGFDGLPPGTDISDRFRLRADTRDGLNLQYFPTNGAANLLSNPPTEWGTDYYVDFLMTSPPLQPMLFDAAVKITFYSLTSIPSPADTFFTLSPILLQ